MAQTSYPLYCKTAEHLCSCDLICEFPLTLRELIHSTHECLATQSLPKSPEPPPSLSIVPHTTQLCPALALYPMSSSFQFCTRYLFPHCLLWLRRAARCALSFSNPRSSIESSKKPYDGAVSTDYYRSMLWCMRSDEHTMH